MAHNITMNLHVPELSSIRNYSIKHNIDNIKKLNIIITVFSQFYGSIIWSIEEPFNSCFSIRTCFLKYIPQYAYK